MNTYNYYGIKCFVLWADKNIKVFLVKKHPSKPIDNLSSAGNFRHCVNFSAEDNAHLNNQNK